MNGISATGESPPQIQFPWEQESVCCNKQEMTELMWFKSANMLLFSFTLQLGYCTWTEIFQFLLFFSFTFFLSTADRRLSGRTRALSVDYGQTKNGTPLFFSHTPAPCRYSNLLPPLTTPLWSMELKQGGWEGPSVPIFDPTGAVLNLEAFYHGNRFDCQNSGECHLHAVFSYLLFKYIR